MELGIYTFGDITPDPNTGRAISTAQRYAEAEWLLVSMAALVIVLTFGIHTALLQG